MKAKTCSLATKWSRTYWGDHVLSVDGEEVAAVVRIAKGRWTVRGRGDLQSNRLAQAQDLAEIVATNCAARAPSTLRQHLVAALEGCYGRFLVYAGQYEAALKSLEITLTGGTFPRTAAWVNAFVRVVACRDSGSADYPGHLSALACDAMREPRLLGILADAAADAGRTELESAARTCMQFSTRG